MTEVEELDPRAQMEQEAREWLVRLDGDEPLTTAQRRALKEWINRSTVHRDVLAGLAKHWERANVLTELLVLSPPGPGRKAFRVGRPQALKLVGASVALLGFVSVVAWLTHSSDLMVNGTYATEVGQERSIVLPDGSSIVLNTNSLAEVGYSRQQRTIRLTRGEALFTVAHDPDRPFQVYAAANIVRALGTAFSVHVENGRVNVMVTDGTVDVSAMASAPVWPVKVGGSSTSSSARSLGHLKAGQTSTTEHAVAPLEVQQLTAPEVQRRIAWREGFLAFSGQSLAEVVEQVNRYSSVRLEIADPALNTVAIGGRFRIGDLEGVLGALHDNLGIQATRPDERTIRLQRAPSRE